MSVTVYWRPVDPQKHYLEAATSSFISALGRAFGPIPVKLSVSQIPKLEGMATMYEYKPNPYENLINKIHEFGQVEVWGEY